MRKLLVVTALLTMAACGSDKSSGPAPITGVYTLQTLNGEGMPVTLFEDPNETVELTGSTITLNADLTARVTFDVRSVVGSDTTETTDRINGTYELRGEALSITIQGNTTDATLRGTTITITDGLDVWIYRK